MSKLNPLYERWDVKYFYKLHLERMQQMNQISVTYAQFYLRLKKWMRLRDAIYTPSNTKMVRNRYNMKPQTKTQKLKEKLTTIRIRFISLFK